MTNPCISVVSKSGDRLIVNVPVDFRDQFPHGTDVELVKVEKKIVRIDVLAREKVALNLDAGDFVRGRTFGIHGTIRTAIVVRRDSTKVWWAWISSVNDIGHTHIDDVIDKCAWLGSIDYDLLETVEKNGCTHD